MEKEIFVYTAAEILSASKDDLIELRFRTTLKALREQIITHLMSRRNEDDYFNLDAFTRHGNFKTLVETVRSEIESSGWKTELSFNDTGLFIFKNEKPRTCW